MLRAKGRSQVGHLVVKQLSSSHQLARLAVALRLSGDACLGQQRHHALAQLVDLLKKQRQWTVAVTVAVRLRVMRRRPRRPSTSNKTRMSPSPSTGVLRPRSSATDSAKTSGIHTR